MPSYEPLYRYIFHGTRLISDPAYRGSLAANGLDEGDNWHTFQKGQIISEGTTTCIKTQLAPSQNTVYFKRYSYLKHKWRFFLRRSKAATELVNYLRLKSLNIPTLDVVALYEQRILGRLSTACIITKEIPNTQQFDHFYTQLVTNHSLEKRAIILDSIKQQLFAQLRAAHAAGFFHLDLKWRNILIQQQGDHYTPIWIDCPRGIQRRYANYSLKVADLSGLARKATSFFSTQQLYRMLYEYLGEAATKKQARRLFLAINDHLARRPPDDFFD
ncbi:MAG: lipopolysaccharide kinase InaA family protein [Cycloclasticus sp.]